MDLGKIQAALRDARLDGWLFYDFHNRDVLSYRVLGMDPAKFTSRRWFYLIPAAGEPRKLAHRVEPTKLDLLPGKKEMYLSWRELHRKIGELLRGMRRVAMQYSPLSNIPYVSMVDGGILELVRQTGVEVVSSADLVQTFEAVLDQEAYQSHVEAAARVDRIRDEAFAEVGRRIHAGKPPTEYEIQQFIVRRFGEEGLTCKGENPIVGVNDHPANPHFEPTPENSYTLKAGDTLLIDLWAKLDRPKAVFYDITWCGFIGRGQVPPRYAEIFATVRDARRAAVDFVRRRFAAAEAVAGFEVDDACRKVVADAGYGAEFVHRTGHSIGEEVHGNGVNIDNLETRDERLLVPGICFSVEPGIYLEGEMAARSEINVFITPAGEVTVAGRQQEELVVVDA
ncbi:MAG: aminopeptidase P family protein [Planctomycetes bacterium]|nr:aminopeptidase P family protein [Planctomycetota bacterium]